MKKIVIIDDSPSVLQLTKTRLESAGYLVTAFNDPRHFEPAKLDTQDLIMVDVNMPEFYGDDIVSYLREELPVPVPIYLFSNISESELEKRAKDCGADGYFCKTLGLETLIESVRLIVGA